MVLKVVPLELFKFNLIDIIEVRLYIVCDKKNDLLSFEHLLAIRAEIIILSCQQALLHLLLLSYIFYQ